AAGARRRRAPSPPGAARRRLRGGGVAAAPRGGRGPAPPLGRRSHGLELPLHPPQAPPKEKKEAGAGAAGASGGGVSVAVREVRIERSHVTLRDETVTPAVEWSLDSLDARARGQLGTDAPVDFTLAGRLAGAPLHAAG